MNSSYWEQMEVQESFKEWFEFYEGCITCACDHGCNQWLAEQVCRTALVMRVLKDQNATTSLDKLVSMPLKKVNRIWHRISMWNCERFNRKLRENRDEQKQ